MSCTVLKQEREQREIYLEAEIMDYESDEQHNETEIKEDPKKEMKEVSQHYMSRKQLSNLDVCIHIYQCFNNDNLL